MCVFVRNEIHAKILSGVIYDMIKANKQCHFIRTSFLHGEYRLNTVQSVCVCVYDVLKTKLHGKENKRVYMI